MMQLFKWIMLYSLLDNQKAPCLEGLGVGGAVKGAEVQPHVETLHHVRGLHLEVDDPVRDQCREETDDLTQHLHIVHHRVVKTAPVTHLGVVEAARGRRHVGEVHAAGGERGELEWGYFPGGDSIKRPYVIETMHSYTLPMSCLSGLHLSLLTGGTAVCGHS